MNFLNVGPWELMVILAIAILVVGPRRVAELARTIGRFTAQMRRLSDEFMGAIDTELQDAEQSALGPAISIQTELEATERETRQAMGEITARHEGLARGRPSRYRRIHHSGST